MKQMKWSIKKYLPAVAAVVAGATSTAVTSFQSLANETPSYHLGYPSLVRSQCPEISLSPKVKSLNYYSADCKTVFVLPKKEGEIVFNNGIYEFTRRNCQDLKKATDRYHRNEDQVDKLQDQMDYLIVGSPLWENKNRQLNELLNTSDRLKKRVDDELYDKQGRAYVGATLNFSFEEVERDEYLDIVRGENAETLVVNDMKVARTPIMDSYLTISASKDSGGDYVGKAILGINGIGIGDAISENTFLFNGSLNADVKISPEMACEMMDQYPNLNILKPGVIEGFINGTRTYTIPVQTQMGYKAKLEVKDALNLINRLTERNGKFTSTQTVTMDGEANLSSAVSVEIFYGPRPENTDGLEEKPNFDLDYIQGVKEHMFETFMQGLVRADLLELKRADNPEAPPAGVEMVHTGYSTKCSWFGFKCRTRPVYSAVDRDGFASAVEKYRQTIASEIADEMTVYEIFYNVHSGTMQSFSRD